MLTVEAKSSNREDASTLGARTPRGPKVLANGGTIRNLRTRKVLTQEDVADKAGISVKTVQRAEDGERMEAYKIQDIATVLGVPYESLILEKKEQVARVFREWSAVNSSQQSDWKTLPNGLRVRIHQMMSNTVPGCKARGKLYSLSELDHSSQRSTSELLIRHTATCERVQSPFVVRSYLCEPDQDARFWWIIDEWIDGESLCNEWQAVIRGLM